MTTTHWHLVTGEYPPQGGGVSDYTASLARALTAVGDDVHVWAPPAAMGTDVETTADIRVHRLPDVFGESSLRELTAALDECPEPRILLVQYVPHAFGGRGMNVRFCRWVQHRARVTGDDVRVMFHEPYYPFGVWPPHRNVLALANRIMAVLLLSDIRLAYVSTRAWEHRLRWYAPRNRRFVWLPIPASVPPVQDSARVAEWRARMTSATGGHVVGHFGTFGALVSALLGPILELLLKEQPAVRLCLIGPGSDAFASRLCGTHREWRERVTATGRLAASDVSACLKACDVVVQPYADGASGRRTTLMAALVNGVATVTNRGAATEDDWLAKDAVVLTSRADPRALCDAVERVLDDDALREGLAAAGATLYAERFSIEHTVETLTTGRGAA
ncbi:MAG: glycosyltransferase family 4 protein [Gemmatimonadaceae bacterium]